MPDIKFTCPSCDQSIEAPEDMLGETIECPSCNRSIQIPDPKAQLKPHPSSGKARRGTGIQFECPSCGKSLKVGIVSLGKSIKCPACKSTCEVPKVRTRQAPISQTTVACPSPTVPDTIRCPSCGLQMLCELSLQDKYVRCVECNTLFCAGHKTIVSHEGESITLMEDEIATATTCAVCKREQNTYLYPGFIRGVKTSETVTGDEDLTITMTTYAAVDRVSVRVCRRCTVVRQILWVVAIAAILSITATLSYLVIPFMYRDYEYFWVTLFTLGSLIYLAVGFAVYETSRLVKAIEASESVGLPTAKSYFRSRDELAPGDLISGVSSWGRSSYFD